MTLKINWKIVTVAAPSRRLLFLTGTECFRGLFVQRRPLWRIFAVLFPWFCKNLFAYFKTDSLPPSPQHPPADVTGRCVLVRFHEFGLRNPTPPESKLPPFGPIEGQKWFDQISSHWEYQKNLFAFIAFGKIQFLPPFIWNLPFMSYRLWVHRVQDSGYYNYAYELSLYLSRQSKKCTVSAWRSRLWTLRHRKGPSLHCIMKAQLLYAHCALCRAERSKTVFLWSMGGVGTHRSGAYRPWGV